MSGDVEQATSSLAGLEVSESEPSPSSPAAQPSEPGAAAAALAEQPEGQASLTVPLKLLVPQAAAGCIIGKNGETITRIQAESSARLQLSRANEFFPGTNDRVLLISGTLKVVIAGLHFVLGKVQEEQVSALSANPAHCPYILLRTARRSPCGSRPPPGLQPGHDPSFSAGDVQI